MIPEAVGNGVYQLLAGVSGALIVVIVALGIAIARTREQVAKVEAKLEALKDEVRSEK